MAQDHINGHKKYLSSLDVQRQALESEAGAIVSELTAKTEEGGEPMGIDTPLIDKEGYPRGDIDVYRTRTLRGRLAVIRNDHKALMNQIQEGLVKLNAFQSSADNIDKDEHEARLKPKPKPKFDKETGKWVVMNWDGSVAGVKDGDKRTFNDLQKSTEEEQIAQVTQSMANQAPIGSTRPPAADLIPFARINSVAPSSPAEEAALKEGDLVCQFGSVNATNHNNLQALGQVVPLAASNNERITLVVKRDNEQKTLVLRPKPWGGRGLLGCHIVPSSQ